MAEGIIFNNRWSILLFNGVGDSPMEWRRTVSDGMSHIIFRWSGVDYASLAALSLESRLETKL